MDVIATPAERGPQNGQFGAPSFALTVRSVVPMLAYVSNVWAVSLEI